MSNHTLPRVACSTLIAAAAVTGMALAAPAIGHAAPQRITLPDYTLNYLRIQQFYELGGKNANGTNNSGVAASVQCQSGYQDQYPGWYIDATSYRIGTYPDSRGFYVRAQCEAYKF